ncbi:hypothetical protein EDD21DRAFT_382667 [Dissophora ornata]|nr:hypothetical protein BGZ58_004857 [Dissophora ornata]KAI8598379.1 hypothetical protein EDD21DRAFT_382667 [Dissophora ornata]
MAPIDKKSSKVKVVLTGFEPFGKHITNPSWLAVQPLNNTTLDLPAIPADKANPKHHNATHVDLFSQELPVEYRKVPDLVSALHARHSRKDGQEEEYLKTYYIHVGVGLDGSTEIETQAHLTGYSTPDNAQWAPPTKDEPPVKKEAWAADPKKLTTTVNTAALAMYLKKEKKWICERSLDAGHYLCEYTFYLSLAERNRRIQAGEEGEDERVCLFVHLPSVGNPYSLEELQLFIKDVIVAVASQY